MRSQVKRRVGVHESRDPTDQLVARAGSNRPRLLPSDAAGLSLVRWPPLVVAELLGADDRRVRVALTHDASPRCAAGETIVVAPTTCLKSLPQGDAGLPRRGTIRGVRRDPEAAVALTDVALAVPLAGFVGDDEWCLYEQQHVVAGGDAPVAETPGFGEALFRLVRELRSAGYDLADLGPLLDGTTDAAQKAGSLTEILATFEQRRIGFYGPDDALVAADPPALNGLGLLVWGVLDMPPALERLIIAVAERMPVDVYLPDVPAAAQAPVADLGRRLVEHGGALIIAERSVEPEVALGRLRAALFTPPSGPGIAPDDTVQLVSAPDPAREVRAAARA